MTSAPDQNTNPAADPNPQQLNPTSSNSSTVANPTNLANLSNPSLSLTNISLLNEIKQIKTLLPKSDFFYANDRQCLFAIKKTKYRSLKLKIDIIKDYPFEDNSLLIEITSKYLSNRLIKQLKKGIQKIIINEKSKPRVYKIIKSLNDIIQNNLLTYAFDEVYKIRKLFKNNQNITLKINESKGKIDFKMKHNEYKSHFLMNIPELYPLSPVMFVIKSSSFPERYQSMYTSIANNICDKLSKGFDIEYILNRKVILKGDTSSVDNIGFNSNTVIDIRNDLKTMHKMSLFHNKLMNNAGVRRKIRVMNKQVINEEKKEKDLRKELNNQTYIDPNKQIAEPGASLLICIKYLIKQFSALPNEICSICNKNVFPSSPLLLNEYENNIKKYKNKGKYPQRSNCGHWYHHQCLEKFLSEPPFGKDCPCCGAKLKHPLFETDVKVLEKQWAEIQAKKRELDDVDQFVNDFFN